LTEQSREAVQRFLLKPTISPTMSLRLLKGFDVEAKTGKTAGSDGIHQSSEKEHHQAAQTAPKTGA
jgi:hypothetical protein